HLDRASDSAEMGERFFERDVIVSTPQRPCESRAGCRQRGKSELHKKVCTAHIPGIWEDETTRLMQLAKAIGTRSHGPRITVKSPHTHDSRSRHPTRAV